MKIKELLPLKVYPFILYIHYIYTLHTIHLYFNILLVCDVIQHDELLQSFLQGAIQYPFCVKVTFSYCNQF